VISTFLILDPSKSYVCILHKKQDGTEYNKPNGNPYQSDISYEEKYKEQSMKSTTNYADSSPPQNHRFGRGLLGGKLISIKFNAHRQILFLLI
jgi:hypothetical protein